VRNADVTRPGLFARLAMGTAAKAARSCVFGLVAFAAMSGCATDRPFVWLQDLPPIAPIPPDGLIHSRDSIVVGVRDQPTMSGEFVVRDDGGCLLPTIGEVRVNGRTPTDVAAELKARLKDLIVAPMVTVSVAKVAPIRISVVGEVKNPGVFELNRDRTVTGALATAGWVGDFAASDRVFLVRRPPGELRVRFRLAELTTPDPRAAAFALRDGDVIVVE
jgi:polysaccharide export outer membrane protein